MEMNFYNNLLSIEFTVFGIAIAVYANDVKKFERNPKPFVSLNSLLEKFINNFELDNLDLTLKELFNITKDYLLVYSGSAGEPNLKCYGNIRINFVTYIINLFSDCIERCEHFNFNIGKLNIINLSEKNTH